MKKIEISVEERLTYKDELIVIQPDGMSDESFNQLVDEALKQNKMDGGGSKDLSYILEDKGLKVDAQTYSFPDCPEDNEFEIVSVREMK